MQRGTVLSFKGCNAVLDFLKQNNILIILFLFYFFGVIFGVFSYGRLSLFDFNSADFIEDYITIRTGVGFLKIAVNSLFSAMLAMLVCFACGSSMLGTALVPFYICGLGYFYGQIAAVLYAEHSLKGIAFHTVIVLPPSVLLTIALLLASKESIKFSLNLAQLTLPSACPKNLFYDFKTYCGKYLILCILILLSALVDAVISCNLLEKISIL